ncbi:MAG: geranylgeranylglycerol-phosphate geranylgeranyltransferase [Chitinophagaceae bacterium]
MKLLGAFFKLVRYPNLVFIALTQVLFYYCILLPTHQKHPDSVISLGEQELIILIISSLCIAAAGYIINDYFDLNIDKVNRPDRLVIEKMIKRRWAILWHLSLSATGLALSFYLGWKINNPLPGIFNTIAVILLWFYSTTFKKQILIGNIIISLLTAWVVLVIYICEVKLNIISIAPIQLAYINDTFQAAVLYGGFAFILSVIREAVKDMEDIEGDSKYNCRTMPITWGIRASKVYTAVWIFVLSAALLILSVFAVQIKWWWLSVYIFAAVLTPLYYIFKKLRTAMHSRDFGAISTLVKLVMLTGILSMLFFKWYIG